MIKTSFMLSNNLGDGVYISSLLNAAKKEGEKVMLFLRKDALGEAFYSLYKDLAECVFYSSYEEAKRDHPEVIESHHAITAHGKTSHMPRLLLDYFGFYERNEIPRIQIDWLSKLRAEYFVSQFKNPIAILPCNCGSEDPENYYANYRKPPFDFLQNIVDAHKKNHDFLQFGVSPNHYRDGYSNFLPLKNTIKLLDVPVDKLAALYWAIGKMISGDTGDCHLMVAMGGKANILVPDNDEIGYQYRFLHYRPEAWSGKPRARYMNFNELQLDNVVNFT